MKDKNAVEQIKRTVHEFKQYIRTDFYLHIKEASKVADHCFTWAVSDPEEEKFSEHCETHGEVQHTHSVRCQRCALFDSAMDSVKKLLQSDLDETNAGLAHGRNARHRGALEKRKEELEDLMYDLEEAEQQILALKKHIVRSKISEETRKRIVEELTPTSALLTIDFAQKILPMEYREAQRVSKNFLNNKGTGLLRKARNEPARDSRAIKRRRWKLATVRHCARI